MSAIDEIIGLDAKLYYNTGTYASPVWTEIDDAQDVSLNMQAGEAEAKRRGGGGWGETIAGLKEATIEFGLLHRTSSTPYQAVRDAFLNRTTIELLVLNGASTNTGSEGLRATCHITQFNREEPLEEALTFAVTAKPTPNADAVPAWFTVS